MRFYVRSYLNSEVLDQTVCSYYAMIIYKYIWFKSLSQSFLTVKVSVRSSAEKTATAQRERSASAMAVATCAHQPRKQVRLSALPDVLVPAGIYALFCPPFQQLFNSN